MQFMARKQPEPKAPPSVDEQLDQFYEGRFGDARKSAEAAGNREVELVSQGVEMGLTMAHAKLHNAIQGYYTRLQSVIEAQNATVKKEIDGQTAAMKKSIDDGIGQLTNKVKAMKERAQQERMMPDDKFLERFAPDLSDHSGERAAPVQLVTDLTEAQEVKPKAKK